MTSTVLSEFPGFRVVDGLPGPWVVLVGRPLGLTSEPKRP